MSSLSPSSLAHPRPSPRGFTLVEILMSFTILAVGIMGFIGAFMTVSKSIQGAKTRAVATSLLQEKVEALKNIAYYRLLPTTAPATASELGVTPFQYDPYIYPPETLTVGDIQYTRRVYVEKANATGAGVPAALSYQTPDSGLKRVKAYVIWRGEGSSWKMLEMQNLVNNPNRQFLGARITGTTVNSGGTNLTGVTVMTVENSSQFDQTNAGAYTFSVAPGVYTLQATMPGYFPVTLSGVTVADASTTTWNPALTLMSKGTVTGTAYLRNHLVISRVVGSTISAGFDAEFVEIYNPSTFTWTVADLSLFYWGKLSDPSAQIFFSPTTGSIPPNTFFLFANTTTVSGVAADAMWTAANAGNPGLPNFTIGDPNAIGVWEDAGSQGLGGLKLVSATRGVQDRVGWVGGGSSTPPNPDVFEGTPVTPGGAQGLNEGEQLRRYSTPAAYVSGQGPAYDSNNNSAEVDYSASVTEPPRNSGTTLAPVTGTPALGAYASADDGLSDVVQADAAGAFSITSVATGTWNVGISSGTNFVSFSTTVASNGQVVNAGTFAVTGSTTSGFITGFVLMANGSPLSGIMVQEAAGASGTSGLNGRYKIVASTGLTAATANPNNISNLSYVSETITGLTVTEGTYLNGIDFRLDSGGRIAGRIQIGANPLPGIPITATSGTVTAAEAISDANGYFTLRNLSTATYSVVPQLEAGETYSVSGTSVPTLASAGQLVWSATFTVTNAFGWITGSLTAAGAPINTGVLVFATTSTLAAGAYPPDLTDSLRSGSAAYYSASSLTDGTYEIAAPGGNPGTPITYNVYGWYTTFNGSTPTTVRRNTTASVTGGVTVTGRNLSW